MKHQNINSSRVLFITCMFLFVLFACKDHKPESNTGSNNEKSEQPEVPDVDLTMNTSKEQAIEKVRYELRRTQRKITINVNYWEFENKRVPCTQYDVDLGRNCSGQGVGAPYGYMTKVESVRKCCRTKDIILDDIRGEWVADYSQAEDKWKVAFEFSIDDVKQVYNWVVADNSGQVSDN